MLLADAADTRIVKLVKPYLFEERVYTVLCSLIVELKFVVDEVKWLIVNLFVKTFTDIVARFAMIEVFKESFIGGNLVVQALKAYLVFFAQINAKRIIARLVDYRQSTSG